MPRQTLQVSPQSSHVLWWEQRLVVLLSSRGWVRAGPERQLGAVGEMVPNPTFKNVL